MENIWLVSATLNPRRGTRNLDINVYNLDFYVLRQVTIHRDKGLFHIYYNI